MARKKRKKNGAFSPRKAIFLIILVAGCLIMARGLEWDYTQKPEPEECQDLTEGNLLDVRTAPGAPEVRKQYLGMVDFQRIASCFHMGCHVVHYGKKSLRIPGSRRFLRFHFFWTCGGSGFLLSVWRLFLPSSRISGLRRGLAFLCCA